ncbi:MAG: PilZ domain-containing protein [Candidatus Hydrogenedentes bacterium]|nr:PilZ domain-containing protein [Candidatus Hydrogenedentota bacterium]
MTVKLKQNDPVQLTIGTIRRENARVKEWIDNGCICLSFGGRIALRPGTKVLLEIPNSTPRAFYYLQAMESLEHVKTELRLSRNTNSQFDQRRRSWRVPYSSKTGIRSKGSQQYIDAEFNNISMNAAYLLASNTFEVGTLVELRLILPEYPEHTLTARVMRTSDTALDKDASGNARYGVLLQFENMPKIVVRYLTYFMWQQIRKTHLQQLKMVFASTGRKKRKPAQAPKETKNEQQQNAP